MTKRLRNLLLFVTALVIVSADKSREQEIRAGGVHLGQVAVGLSAYLVLERARQGKVVGVGVTGKIDVPPPVDGDPHALVGAYPAEIGGEGEETSRWLK